MQTTAAPAADESGTAIPAAAPSAAPPTVELAEGDGIPAPRLLGKTVREVTQDCLKLGLTPSLVGTGVATMQSPEAGALIRRGSRITVQFGRTATLLSASARGKAK
jgi:cell division protein FtsI (penicillin-binding protein 3)